MADFSNIDSGIFINLTEVDINKLREGQMIAMEDGDYVIVIKPEVKKE